MVSLSPIRCVVFDIGNTLHQHDEKAGLAGLRAQLTFLKRKGYSISLKEWEMARDWAWEKRRQVKMHSTNLVARFMLQAVGISPTPRMAERVNDLFYDTRMKINPYKSVANGAKDIVSFLKKTRVCVGIITNADSSWSRKWLRKHNFGISNDMILISHEEKTRKPHKRIFDIFYSRVKKHVRGIKRNQILMVGDKDNDFSAQRAGFQTCWYNPRKQKRPDFKFRPNFEISHFSELKKIVG